MKTIKVKLEEIAIVESSKKGKIYPKGSILFEKSATKGVVEYLKEEGEVDSRYAVAVVSKDYNSLYIYEYINHRYLPWFVKNVQGINLPWETIKKFPLFIHEDRKEQDYIADKCRKCDEVLKTEKETLNTLEEVKKTLLTMMFI